MTITREQDIRIGKEILKLVAQYFAVRRMSAKEFKELAYDSFIMGLNMYGPLSTSDEVLMAGQHYPTLKAVHDRIDKHSEQEYEAMRAKAWEEGMLTRRFMIAWATHKELQEDGEPVTLGVKDEPTLHTALLITGNKNLSAGAVRRELKRYAGVVEEQEDGRLKLLDIERYAESKFDLTELYLMMKQFMRPIEIQMESQVMTSPAPVEFMAQNDPKK
jgi:hypothetical protein